MAKILVVYYSRSGNTRIMAEMVAQGTKNEGAEVDLKEVARVKPEELLNYDGIIIGSPTYYGTLAWEVKKLLDESVKFHGKLEGKVGGAFSSAANIGGGNETTILSILEAMLIHGMVIQGAYSGDHYGPVAINEPDARAKKQCLALGGRIARLAGKLVA
ncbi:MAG: NAD(P)H-dependent oxidoreductase [Candidatus Omnitrophica bacterium]|nr:NAD(P)H-dependent oxidoreductase [Candidatus Omnitrophota bacterium]